MCSGYPVWSFYIDVNRQAGPRLHDDLIGSWKEAVRRGGVTALRKRSRLVRRSSIGMRATATEAPTGSAITEQDADDGDSPDANRLQVEFLRRPHLQKRQSYAPFPSPIFRGSQTAKSPFVNSWRPD